NPKSSTNVTTDDYCHRGDTMKSIHTRTGTLRAKSRLSLQLIAIAAGMALVGATAYGAGDAATASAALDAALAAPDAVGVVEKAKPNQLGRHIDYDVEWHEGTNHAAVPSPDGRQIVMSIQGGLWILPVNGGKAKKITPFSIEATQPAWSPNGRWIAFQNY